MKVQKTAAWVFVFLCLKAGWASGQSNDGPSRIENNRTEPVFYCNGPLVIAPDISVKNIDFETSSDGLKISVTNYKRGEDTLFYSGNSSLTARWDPGYGNLELTGKGTAEAYEMAVAEVYYENLSDSPSQEPRSLSISLIDADYLPETGHFYKYIPEDGIAWSEAKDSTEKMDYFGLQGYLATITSSVENDFIWTKIDGVGWIGASDAASEGTWKWVTGPEAGTVFWRGNYNGGPVGGEFSYWNTGEPNNVGDEDYAHVNAHPDLMDKSWNDLPDIGGGGAYYPRGFVVEFGGSEGDPDVQLSASAVVEWSSKPEIELAGFDSLVCGEKEQPLTLKFEEEGVSTLVTSLGGQTEILDETSPNPTIRVSDFGHYRFEVEITNRHQCIYYDTLEIRFQHQPTADFFIDSVKCKGYNLDVLFTGTTDGPADFVWYSSDTVFASGTDLDSVRIPLGFGLRNRRVGLKVDEGGCVTDMNSEEIRVTPAMNFWVEENAEGCTPLNVKFGNEDVEDIDHYFWDFGDGDSSIQSEPEHMYVNPELTDTVFDVALMVVSTEGCENRGMIENAVTVHPVPAIDFDFDENACHGKSGTVNYVGSGTGRDTYRWDLSDFLPGEVMHDPGNSPGPLEFKLLKRPIVEIGLQVVSEFGCQTDTVIKSYRRKPLFYVPPDPVKGCPPLEASLFITTSDSVDEVDYLWDPGNGETAHGDSVFLFFSDAGQNLDVKMVAHSSLTGCSDTLLLPEKIQVYPVPEAVFLAQPPFVTINEPMVSFNNQSNGATEYDWDFDDGTGGSEEENPQHRFSEMGTYNVELFVRNDHGCADSAFAEVMVAFDRLFPPTAFSPNASREEDREFRIHAEGVNEEGYRLLIYNRWGQVIFESRSQQKGWDGKMKNGDFAPAGVYAWAVWYFDFLGRERKQQGTVTLLF